MLFKLFFLTEDTNTHETVYTGSASSGAAVRPARPWGQYRPAPASAGPAAGGPAPHRRAVPSLGSFPSVIDLLVRRLSIVDIPRGENLAMLGSTFSDFLRSLSKSAEASATRVPVNVLGGLLFFSAVFPCPVSVGSQEPPEGDPRSRPHPRPG